MAKKSATDLFLTPAGTLSGYVALQVPSAKYDAYNATIHIDMDDAGKKLHGYLKKLQAYALKKFEYDSKSDCHTPWEVDDDVLKVKTKLKATIKTRKGDVIEKKIAIFDAAAKKVEKNLNIGEGTVCRIQISPYFWETGSKCGITLQPSAVQIIELVKFEGGGKSNPFEAVDGSFKPGNDDVFGDDDDDDLDAEITAVDVDDDDDDDIGF